MLNPLSANPQNGQTHSNNSSAFAFIFSSACGFFLLVEEALNYLMGQVIENIVWKERLKSFKPIRTNWLIFLIVR